MKKHITWDVKENGCWEINSHVRNYKKGYCKFHRYGKKIFIHRYIYEELFGFIPDGMVVRHKCDNQLCINPEHLELGTIQDNNRDIVERQRNLRGSQNNLSKLKEEQVVEIKKSDKNEKELAILYNVTRQTINRIKNNKIWRHI